MASHASTGSGPRVSFNVPGYFNTSLATPTRTLMGNASSPDSKQTLNEPSTSTAASHANSPDPRKNAKGFLKVGKKMVTIYVGDDVEPFTVHHDLITATSDFFSKALNDEFKERNGELRLPDHQTDHFAAYIQWLYEGRVEAEAGTAYRTFLQLTVLGTYLRDRHFRNAVMSAMCHQMTIRKSWPGGLGNLAYKELPASSPFRKFCVDVWACGSSAWWFDGNRKQEMLSIATPEFWFDIVADLVRHPEKRGQRPWLMYPCQYHEHVEGEAKCP
ncbi:hypothetical protein EG327_006669 [Venturia inaequalis]|uniref:BTB domain-containing protein n=2 Tax=Venturia inaequalis TaxID=5025 RepID=A0A8H3V3T7_VENIN|nr:hypothetical protein EG327_006669 [Venturia inaequalis]